MRNFKNFACGLAVASLLSVGVASPSQALRLEADHENGDHVFSLNQTDQKLIVATAGGGFAGLVGKVLGSSPGTAGAIGGLGSAIFDLGTCPDDQALYISYKTNQVVTPHAPEAEITGFWCH